MAADDYRTLHSRKPRDMRFTEVAEMQNSLALAHPPSQIMKTDKGSELLRKCWADGRMKEASRSTSKAWEYLRITLP